MTARSKLLPPGLVYFDGLDCNLELKPLCLTCVSKGVVITETKTEAGMSVEQGGLVGV